MTKPEFTDEQVMDAITQALRDEDIPLVGSLLHILAAQAPHEAEVIATLVHRLAAR